MALGQSVLVPPPNFQDAGSRMPNFENASGTENQTVLKSVESAVTAPLRGLFQWGGVHLQAQFTYQFLFASGVQVQPGQKEDTLTHTFSPNFSAALGPHWTFDYAPSYRMFSQKDFRDTLDHSLSLMGSTTYKNWMFSLSQSYSLSDEPTIVTGGQTKQQSYSAGGSAAYSFNSKWSEVTSFNVGLNFVDQSTITTTTNSQPLTDTQNFSLVESVNYQISQPVSAGLSISVGTSDQANGFSSINEQYSANMSWVPGPKLSAALSAGIQTQQFLDSNQNSSDLNPIFTASITYHLFAPTTLTLTANHSISASLFQNQNTESTQLNLALQQQLLRKLSLTASFGYNTSDYVAPTAGGATLRTDDGYSLNVGLSTGFLRHGSVSVFYAYSKNNSSQAGFQYASSQMGATVGWKF
jgi:hypothetical protein